MINQSNRILVIFLALTLSFVYVLPSGIIFVDMIKTDFFTQQPNLLQWVPTYKGGSMSTIHNLLLPISAAVGVQIKKSDKLQWDEILLYGTIVFCFLFALVVTLLLNGTKVIQNLTLHTEPGPFLAVCAKTRDGFLMFAAALAGVRYKESTNEADN